MGLIRLAEDYMRTGIAAGQLVPVLKNWCLQLLSWLLYYPSRRQMSSAFRTFLHFVAKQRLTLGGSKQLDCRCRGMDAVTRVRE